MADPGPIRPADAVFPERRTSIQSDKCASCGKPATHFRDAASKKEYRISGFCQACQDATFGLPQDEDGREYIDVDIGVGTQRFYPPPRCDVCGAEKHYGNTKRMECSNKDCTRYAPSLFEGMEGA